MAHAGRLRLLARKLCTEVTETEPKKKQKLYKRIGEYLLNILNDYKIVAEETLVDMKKKPFKSSVYLSLLGTSGYLFKTNPSELTFKAQLLENSNELLMLGQPIRNPVSDNHVQRMLQHYNAGELRRFTIGICSVMWVDNFDKDVDVFEAHAEPLKVGWLDMKDRIVDIGINGKWQWLEKAMNDYDINPGEWPEEETKKKDNA